jgi:hypothetical protein
MQAQCYEMEEAQVTQMQKDFAAKSVGIPFEA